MGYRGYSPHGAHRQWRHKGYGPHGQCGHRGKWGTGGVGYKASEAHMMEKRVKGVFEHIDNRKKGGNGVLHGDCH